MGALGGKLVLVVDDAPDMRLICRKALETEGARVLEAESVEQGLVLAEREKPHLVVLDLVFPKESGFDFLNKRLSETWLRAIPVLVLSGQNDFTSVQQAATLGTAGYLVKPFKTALFLQKIRKLLNAGSFRMIAAPGDGSPARAVVAAEIRSASEAGILIEAPVKLELGAEVEIRSDWVKSLGVGSLMVRAARSGSFVQSGRYYNDLSLAGMNEATAKALRKALGGGK